MVKLVYAIPLMLVGLMVGMHLAYATNESSYRYGYEQGKMAYKDSVDLRLEADPHGAKADCYSPVYEGANATGYPMPHYDIMTNQTTCVVGWIDGYNSICSAKNSECPWPNTPAYEIRAYP
jgi:hypothetical protein